MRDTKPPAGATAHVDTFCRDLLPPPELWPEMDYSGLAELAYPDRMNCAADLLDARVAEGNGDRIAFHFAGGTWTYRELLEKANRIAHVLVDDFGLVPGNRVLLRGFNNPMMAACWFAVLKAGGIVVATMPLLRVRELVYMIDKARIGLVLTDARIRAEADQSAEGRNVRAVDFNTGELEERMEGKPTDFKNCDTAADDIALLAFTSGTTGNAKGTIHFHRDVIAVCDCFPPYVLKPHADDVFAGSPPFAFTYGLGGLILFPMRIGASAVLLEQAAPPHLIKGIQDFKATVVFTAPTAYRAMLPMLPQHDISSLRACVSAGETLPLPTWEAWREATGLRIIDGIGSTEILHIFISESGDGIRPGATGRAVPGYQARIVDEDGNEQPPGTVGRLAVKGPTGCRYLDDPERQRGYVQNGWNLTGDSFSMDEDGYFWYQARTDDMIISSGINISGLEVESVLLEHPKILECGVVGVPDVERGHVVKAFIVLRPGNEGSPELIKELQDYVKSQIAPYKYPRQIDFVESLPRTLTGKLQRFRLRERES
ncbi:MAG TPA: AMP-binding protein [Thermoanaerobaculia bacterium]|jgi:2-aminobenzoate-CoA ligase|nr:AMP-binding protein [Thermoanaerobaculia bacterium]